MTQFTVQEGDYAPFHSGYVRFAREKDIVAFLQAQSLAFSQFLNAIPAEKADYAYAPGKWTVKQVIQHIIDAERIFAFRLLAMSRGEKQPIPGFEQEDYALAVDVSGRSLADQLREFESVRHATMTLIHSISPVEAERKGTVSGYPLTARALPFIIAGHIEHHLEVMKEKYGLS